MESTSKRKAPESEEKGPSLAQLRKLLKGKPEKEEENPNEETDNNKMRRMKQTFKQLKEKLTKLNKELLTIADGSYSLLKPNTEDGEILLSWRIKRPDMICPNVTQMSDDCWAHSFHRGIYAIAKKLGYTGIIPSADDLVGDIDPKYLTNKKSLVKEGDGDLVSVLERKYHITLEVHHRPKLDDVEGNELFEQFLERQLAIAPVSVCFSYLPGYYDFPHEDKKVFCPSGTDIVAMQCERLPAHCSVITGRGVLLEGGKSTEFWEIHETDGDDLGDNGFTRLERRKGIIALVYIFKIAHPN